MIEFGFQQELCSSFTVVGLSSSGAPRVLFRGFQGGLNWLVVGVKLKKTCDKCQNEKFDENCIDFVKSLGGGSLVAPPSVRHCCLVVFFAYKCRFGSKAKLQSLYPLV